MSGRLGLAATLYDAAALAEAFGPGAVIGIGHADGDIVAPAGAWLSEAEAEAAARSGRESCFLAFGNAAPAEPAMVAPLIDMLGDVLGTSFMAACVAAPWAGRTVYQGHLFEGARHGGDLVRQFSSALGGPVALVSHAMLRGGPAGARATCTALKEQGRALALLDAIDEADAAVVTEALARMPLTGGGAWLAARAHAVAPEEPAGRLAILAGALDRQTNFQLGAARAAMPVFDLDLAAPDPAAAALAWGPARTASRLAITTTVAPDRVTAGAPAAAILGAVAAGLAEFGVTRMVLAGGETAAAVLAALGETRLSVGAPFGPLRWWQGARVAFCIKPAGIGEKNLFLFGLEPQIRLNAAAK